MSISSGCDAGLAERDGPDCAAALIVMSPPFSRILRRLAGAEDPDRLLLAVTRDVGRGDHDRAAAVGDHAALEQVQRVRDHARLQHVLDRHLANVEKLEVRHRRDGFGVAHRVVARGDARSRRAARWSCRTGACGGAPPSRSCDERHAGEGLHVVDGRARAGAHVTADADRERVAVGGRAVGQQRDARACRARCRASRAPRGTRTSCRRPSSCR